MQYQSAPYSSCPAVSNRPGTDRKRSRILPVAVVVCLLACAAFAHAQTIPTTTVLASSTGAVYAGDKVTLVAVVTAGTTPVISGQVSFNDGAMHLATVQGVAQSNGSLKATLTIPLTGNRLHSILATYLGAPNSKSKTARSASAAVSVQTFTVGLAKSAVTLNQPVSGTLSATVSTNAPLAPAGSVTFSDQSTGQTLGTVSIPSSAVLPVFSPSPWPAGQAPGPLVAADINNDGLPDFAVVNTLDGTVSIFINRAEAPGQFLPAQTFPVGPSPTAIVAADFNADGLIDFAVANSDNTITLLLGSGQPTKLFLPSTISAGVPVGSTLLASDLDGDGLPDLVFIAATLPKGALGALDVLLNTPKTPGTFSTTPSVIGLSSAVHFIATADFNLDGYNDLVADNAIYLSTGTPLHYGAPEALSYACNCQPNLAGLAIGSLTTNGVPSIALMGTAPSGFFVDVVLADATHPGQFLGTTMYSWPSSNSGIYTPAGIAFADLNVDGVPDIFTYGSVFDSVAQTNSPSGTLNLAVTGSPGTFSPMDTFLAPAGLATNALVLDINSDGVADLAFSAPAANNLVTAISSLAVTVTLPGVTVGGSGQQFITASYSGNAQMVSSASPVLQIPGNGPVPASVLMVPSTFTSWTYLPFTIPVTVSQAPSAGGLADRHPGTPSGTVTLWDGSNQVTTATLDATGAATFTPTLTPGDHTLSVSYSGDAAFASASTSSAAMTVYGSSNAAIFNASPNPVQATPGTYGETTLTWNPPAGVSTVAVRINSPDGALLGQTPGPGSVTTGPWVTDGMVFYLQDVSGGKPLTAANTLATIRMHLQTDATFWANPNPIPVAPGAELGVTNLIWAAPSAVLNTELHVNAPDGALLGADGNSGIDATGLWVSNGMTFYLQDVTGGNPLTSKFTVDSVSLSLAPQVLFTASPNPLPDSFLLNNQQTGSTTLSWNAPNSTKVRVRIGSPTGTDIASGGTTGAATASALVQDGTVFYLEDASGGSIDGSVLGSVVVNLQKPVQFTATPNPISAISVANGVESGQTVLTWNSPGRSSVSIVLTRPGSSSQTVVATGGSTGSVALTVQAGDDYMLEDTSVSPPVVIGTVTIQFQHQASFTAVPNPALVQFSSGSIQLAKTTLHWNVSGVNNVAITIAQPNGTVFAQGGSSGSVETGVWVTDGMTFYLQDVTGGKPLTAANTLAVLSVRVH